MYELSYDLIFSETYLGKLIGGIKVALVLFGLSFSFGFLLAVIIGALRTVSIGPLRLLLQWFVEYQRNVPLLVHLLVWYFGIAALLPTSVALHLNRHGAEFVYAVIALSLYGAAYMSEDIRSGLRAIPRGQFESAFSIGLTTLQLLMLVIIPQTLRYALPPIVNQALSLFKNTSIAAAIGVAELMYRSREIATETFRVVEAFSIATVVYVSGSLLIVAIGLVLEWWVRIPAGAGAASR
jgi:polar amino acid transport system permease protein